MSKTNELLGKLGKQMRDFPQVTTFAGAKQAEQAIAQTEADAAAPVPAASPAAPENVAETNPSIFEAEKPRRRQEKPLSAKGGKSVRNFSVTLHQSDIDRMQEIRFLIMKEASKPTVSVSETIRIALRAFRSSKPLSEIIQEVEELDGRGQWRNK